MREHTRAAIRALCPSAKELPDGGITLMMLGAPVIAEEGDYIIKSPAGQFVVVNAGVFAQRFERVDE